MGEQLKTLVPQLKRSCIDADYTDIEVITDKVREMNDLKKGPR
ncbi:hypothetical protein SB861_32965 [Paraburkholderia sp. SIMBA_049]